MLQSPDSSISDHPSLNDSAPFTLQYRRNGKLQACEACRKSKLRCDHVMPTCGRCRRRGRESGCVYISTPTAQPRRRLLPRTTSSFSVDHGNTTPVRPSIDSPVPVASFRPRAQSIGAILGGQRETLPFSGSGRRAQSSDPVPTRELMVANTLRHGSVHETTGFLGATSFQSIFTENLPQFGITVEDARHVEETATPITTPQSDGNILDGIKVVSLLKYRNLFCKQLAAGDDWGYLDPLDRTWYEDIWAVHGQTLQSGDERHLRALVQSLFDNTSRKVEFDASTTMREFAASTSGVNTRWETVGILIAEVAIQAKATRSQDTVWQDDGEKLDRKTFLDQCAEAVEKCVAFCNTTNRLHDMYFWLLECSDDVMTVMLGETALTTYLRGGETISIAISLGLHQSTGGPNTPGFLREIRKCMLMSILTIECRRSMTLGRPPRLHYQYCAIPDLYDIHVSIWLQPTAEIDRAISELVNGWNPHGKFHCTTWIRRQILVVKRRQKMVDLAMIPRTQAEIVYEAEKIRAEMEMDLANLPQSLIEFVQGDDRPGDTPIEKLCRRSARMNDVSDRLSLQRILVQKAGCDSRTLIPHARNLLVQVIHHTTATEIAQYSTIPTVLINYGIRAAAILALELLRDQSDTQRPRDSIELPRSRTIQDLSVFIFCCEQSLPGEDSREVCQQAAVNLRRILDRILDPHAATAAHQPAPIDPSDSHQTVHAVPPPMTGTIVNDVLGFAHTQSSFEGTTHLAGDVDFSNWFDNMTWSMGGPIDPSTTGWTSNNGLGF